MGYSDIATLCRSPGHSVNEFIAVVLSSLFSQEEQRKTVKITARVPLLFLSPDGRQAKISAKNEELLAVNFLP
jgi:hypothetical protein